MKILALDLGTKTGYACNSENVYGTWELATKKEIAAWGKNRLSRRCDPRVSRLMTKVKPFCGWVDCIVIEDVQFSSYTYQTQLWASLRAAVWLACDKCSMLYEAVPVKTLKQFATGNGNATKDMMLAAFQKRLPGVALDDNGVDAYWLLQWAEQNLSRTPCRT